MRLAFSLAMLALATPASASGGFHCTADDEAAKIEIESGVTRGMGSPVFNFRGTLDLPDQAVSEDFRQVAFDDSSLTQYWLDGRVLNLLLYEEREGDQPFGSVELLIQTQAGDEEGLFGGQYTLTVIDMTGDKTGEGTTIRREGMVVCSAD